MDASVVVQTAMDLLIQEIEEDMMKTEDTGDNLEVFSAILWLESPERRYPVDIIKLLILDSQMPLKVLLAELTKRLERLNKVGGAQPVKVKMVLVLCELIKLLPSIGRAADVDICINKILAMHLGSQALGPAKNLILLAIDDVVYLAVVAGSNPVVSIMGNPDVFAVLDNLPAATNNAATFRCALGQMPSLLAMVPVDQRSVFVVRLYDFVSGFFTHNPRVHEKLIADGLNQAQIVIDEMLKWKATPDTEHLCLFAALMPFCPGMLQAMMKSGKKNHPVAVVLHGISEWRKKKDVARYSIACAFLELMDALVIANAERTADFKPLRDFVDKFKSKFDTYMFRHKVKKDGHICGKLLTSWLPRYTAVNFVTSQQNGAEQSCEVTQYTLDSIKKPDGRANIVTFLKLIFRGYPKQIDLNSLLSGKGLFGALSVHFGETLNKLATETKHDPAVLGEAMAIVRFFICDSWKFSPFSLMMLKGAETEQVSISAQMQRFRAVNQTAEAMSRIVGSMLQVIACTTLSVVGPFIQFVRTFMTCESSWEQQLLLMQNSDVMKMVTDIAKTFKQEVDRAFLLASPGLSHLPTLIYRFLVWSEMVLRRTLEKERTPLDQEYIHSITSSLLTLAAVCKDEVIAKCEEVLAKILLMYSGDLYGWLPSKVWEIGGDVGADAVKHVLSAWFGHVAKQLESEKVKMSIPQISSTPVAFETTRERIALIAAFLCRHVYQLASVGVPGTDIKSLEAAFFETCVKYISSSGFTDELFTDTFQCLSSYSFKQLLAVIKAQIESNTMRGSKCQFEKIFFWNNVVSIFASLLKSRNGTKSDRGALYEGIIGVVPSLLSLLQMRIFENNDGSTHLEKYINELYSMLTMFDVDDPRKSSETWRTIVYTSFEICLMYMSEARVNWVEMIFHYLPNMMLNMEFGYSQPNSHVDELSSRGAACKSIHYVIRACSTLIMLSGSKEIATRSHEILDNIMISNSNIAWRVYMNAVATESSFMQSMLIESLALVFNTVPTPILRADLLNCEKPQQEPVAGQRFDPSKRKSWNRQSGSATPISDAEAKKLQMDIHFSRRTASVSQPKADYESLYAILIKDDFDLFRTTNISNLEFMQSAIACCIVFNVHDRLFDVMTKAFAESKVSLAQESRYQLFYTAWFKQISQGWTFGCMTWAYPSAIDDFLVNFRLPPQFLYYLHQFSQTVNDKDIVRSLFHFCFLKPLLYNAWDYGATVKTRDDPGEFLKVLENHPKFDPFFCALLDCETYYTLIHPTNFAMAYKSVAKYVFKRPPPCEIVYPKEKSYLSKVSLPEWKGHEYNTLSRSRWVVSIGQTNLGDAFLLLVRNIPEVSYEALSRYFLSHFSVAMTPIELFVDLTNVSDCQFSYFVTFMNSSPKEFLGRIRLMTFLNLSFLAASAIQKQSWNMDFKIRFCNNLDEVLKGDSIFFPKKYFPKKLDDHYWFSVTVMDCPCRLYIGDGEFILSTNVAVLDNEHANAILRMKASKITSVEGDQDSVKITCSHAGKPLTITLVTQSSTYIVAAWESMQKRVSATQNKLVFARLEETMSPSERVQAIALSIYLLAKRRSIVDRAALQLLHAAIQNKSSPRVSLDVFLQQDGDIDLHQLMLDISDTGLLDDIMFYLSSYISVDDLKACYNLLPLFVMFMNECTDKSAICTVGSKLVSLCSNSEALRVLERQFWLEIESPAVLESLVPIVIASELPSEASRRIVQSLCLHNPEELGRLVVSHYLDGTVRRRSFDEWISSNQVFSVIRTLPFHALKFVNADPPTLIFASVLSSIYAAPALANDTSCFLEAAFTTWTNTSIPAISKNASKLLTFVRSSKAQDPISILHLAGVIAKQISPETKKIYQKLVREPSPTENPSLWYIRAAADVHADGGNYATAVQFMAILPEMFSMDVQFGYQKLALSFRCFSRLIGQFPAESRFPPHLFWAAILCVLHSSKQLRLSAIELLSVLCEFAMKKCGFMNLEDFKHYRHDNINHCISTCEDEIGARFDDNFAFAFIQFLTRAIEETETRRSAIHLLKICIGHMARRRKIALFYMLPLIVFAPEECSAVLASMKGKYQQVPEFLVAKLKKMPEESGLIVGYLASMFGCSPQIDLISDCLVTGAHLCPKEFSYVKPMLVEKCFKMLRLDKNKSSTIDKISSVAGAFLCLDDPVGSKTLGARINVSDIVDDNLKTYIIGVINYIGARLSTIQ